MRTKKTVTLIMALMMLPACTTFEVEGTGAITPDAVTGSETVHGSFYGIRWAQRTVEKCGNDSLFRVEYHTNAAFVLAAVASLGLYVPQTVEWWCYAPVPDDENDEIWDPMDGIAEGAAP